jgi:hypothetical protein
MSTGTNTSTSKIVTIIVLIPILLGLWYVAPFALPMYKWQHVDLEKIAREHKDKGYTLQSLQKEFTFIVWYNPRGGRGSNDPCPWQIVESNPPWKSVYPNDIDEEKLLVRASLVDERDGEAISKLWIGVNPSEAFFRIKGFRLPPGTLGKPQGRPVILFQGLNLEKLDLTDGLNRESTVKQWENDDEWYDIRDDGFRPPPK